MDIVSLKEENRGYHSGWQNGNQKCNVKKKKYQFCFGEAQYISLGIEH